MVMVVADSMPKISVVTPCRNGALFIDETLESLTRQNYPNLEHIVIDACSTDGTLDILAKHPQITVISEPDAGSHEALNKGIDKASGDIIGFLNVDDVYEDNILLDIAEIFSEHPDIDLVVGQSVIFRDETSGQRKKLVVYSHCKDEGLWLAELTFGVPGINGCFFRRRVFQRVGQFINDYDFSGDRQLLIRVALAGLKSKLLTRPSIWYRRHAESRTINPEMRNLMAMSREFFRMAQEFTIRTKGRPKERRIFLAWHAFEGVKLALRSLLRRQAGDAGRVLIDLSLYNPFWPFRLIHALALRRAVRAIDSRKMQ